MTFWEYGIEPCPPDYYDLPAQVRYTTVREIHEIIYYLTHKHKYRRSVRILKISTTFDKLLCDGTVTVMALRHWDGTPTVSALPA